MFVTIWMCTQEWSLISIRATAFTFATCHQRLELVVAVDPADHAAELLVAAHRDVDPHPRDRLGRRQPGLALGLAAGSAARSGSSPVSVSIAMPEHTPAVSAQCTSGGCVMNQVCTSIRSASSSRTICAGAG